MNRSPGYPCKQLYEFQYPDLSLVPSLDCLDKCDMFPSAINRLNEELCKVTGGDAQKARNVSHAIKRELKDTPYNIWEFSKKFWMEHDREQAIIKKQNHKPIGELTDTELQMVLDGCVQYQIDKKQTDRICHLLYDEIEHLRSRKRIKTSLAYDRSISHKRDVVTGMVDGIIRKAGVIKTAETYFGFKMHVHQVTLHISTPDDVHYKQVLFDTGFVPKTAGMHFDPKAGIAKCIMYLKDIKDEDGPFTYLPTTHLLKNPPVERLAAKANCIFNYLNSPQARQDFMNLPERLRRTSIIGTVTADGSSLSDSLLEREESFTADRGGLILFDPAMLHRGGVCKTGDRVALQIAIRGI